jgi:TatD DNase family protein
LTEKYDLPMYLHSRNCEKDFVRIVKENRNRFSTGVVHSYTGTKSELKELVDMGLYIGVNGCSLKTKENLEVVKDIPLDRIMLETDAPYCEIKKTHASWDMVETQFVHKVQKKYDEAVVKDEDIVVKGRNEPCRIPQVLEVVAALKEIDKYELAEIAFQNSLKILSK